MKKLIIGVLALLVSAGYSFAAGGKEQVQHHGEQGEGQVHTGGQAQGEAQQPRTGREGEANPSPNQTPPKNQNQVKPPGNN